MLEIIFPKPILLPGRIFAMYTPHHIWVFCDGVLIHLPGFGRYTKASITRYYINDARIRFHESRSKLKLNFAKFAYGLIGGAVYVAPNVVIMLNTRNFDKYIAVR